MPGISAGQAQNCRVSGSVAQPYPTSNYGIDYADPPTGISQLSASDWFATLLGQFTSVVWDVWLYAIRGALNLLNWAFALKLVQDAMGQVTQSLGILHSQVFGVSWMEAALGVAGLWGIWHGLVRRKTIETIGGLAATVALMIAALVMIAQPQATVGTASAFADEASLTALSGASEANVAQPVQGFANAESGLFAALVLRPWCALEFGDVDYCVQPRDGTTVADIWLAFPPMGPGRQGLYNLATTGSIEQYGGVLGSLGKGLDIVQTPPVTTVADACGGSGSGSLQCTALKNAQALSCYGKTTNANCAFSSAQSNDVQLQAGANALTRLVLLALISAGLLGAMSLLLFLAIHLVFAAIKTLILLLAAPVILLVAAFGQAGRQTVVVYAGRLLGAIVTKLVYAVMLALVVLMAGTIESLKISWFADWMINIVFWWGVFLQRREFVQFLSMDRAIREGGLDVAGHGRPFRIAGALFGGYYAMRFARDLTRGVTALPRAVRRRGFDRRVADS
ncbi:MAG TPA: hypothetical protein VIH71_05760, partial [Solirubrobacteraceae bacterium]